MGGTSRPCSAFQCFHGLGRAVWIRVEKDVIKPQQVPKNEGRPKALRAPQRLGKYRIKRRIATGGFADVFEAEDTIEGLRVALRVPRADLVDDELLAAFKREVRLLARLEHPNILPLKNADFIEGTLVVSSLLGEETLADVLHRRTPVAKLLDYTEQLVRAVAHAHEHGVIHCDVKPDNLILFRDGRLRLGDFGIAKAAIKVLALTASGTMGYQGPEHALGRPSLRSDVFSIGLVVWEMLAGKLPEWPFAMPFPNHERVKRKVHPELIDWIRRSLEVDQRARFRDAGAMLEAYLRLKRAGKLLPGKPKRVRTSKATLADWRAKKRNAFYRQFRKVLSLGHHCSGCGGSMSESMRACPWCGKVPKRYTGKTSMPERCPRCGRGRKLDWRFCAWCYGGGFRQVAARAYPDKRYSSTCTKPGCGGRLMPFMRYCPWCRSKVQRKWKFTGADARCKSCGCSIAGDYWSHCPWCTTKIAKKR